MGLRHRLLEKYPDLFRFLPAKEVHPHDEFLDRVCLRVVPTWITPNAFTLFRVLATPFVFLLINYNYFLIGIIAFVLVAFTDALDGSLARTRDQVTEFGMLFDPLADKLLVGSMVLLIVFENFNPLLGIGILLVEIIIIISALVAKVKFKTVRMANNWGKIKMIMQVVAVCLTLIAMVFNVPYLLTMAAALFGLAIGFALVSLYFQGI